MRNDLRRRFRLGPPLGPLRVPKHAEVSSVHMVTSTSNRAPDNAPTDPELAVVIAAWADLPAAVRAGIVAMVKASSAE